MATFYLLPPRGVLGDFLAESLATLLPGVDCATSARRRLADLLIEGLVLRQDVYLVNREELPADSSAEQGLIDAFGAEPGDEVVEVRVDRRTGAFRHSRWQISEPGEQLGRGNPSPTSHPSRLVG